MDWKMSKGFDISFEGLDMNPDHVQLLLKKYKKVKKYQKSSLFAIKTMDGTEEIVSKMIEEARQEGF
jgi:predicted HAD superfamily hydrolase